MEEADLLKVPVVVLCRLCGARLFNTSSSLSTPLILSDDVSVLLQEIIVEARNLSGAEM